MKNAAITLNYDEEKLATLKLYLGLKEMNLEAELLKSLEALYQKMVPVNVREFLDLRSGTVPTVQPPKPRRVKPGAAEKDEQKKEVSDHGQE